MKKLIGISLVAMLAVSPLAARADVVAGDATQETGTAQLSAAEPAFALAQAAGTDGNAASAGYVKGAYNAAIRAINTVNAKVDTANSNALTTAGDGLVKNGNTVSVDLTSNGGLQVDSSAKTLEVKAGNGVELGSGGVAVKAKTNAGIAVDSNGVAVDAGNGISLDSNGVNVQAKDGSIVVDANGVSVGLTANGGVVKNATNDTLELKVDGTTVEVDATNGLQVKNGGITVAKIDQNDIAKGTGTYASSTDLANQGYVDQQVAGATTGMATQDGVVATIKNTTLTQGAVTQGLNGTVGSTTDTLVIMTNWTDETSTGQSSKTIVTGVNNGSLATNVSVAAPTINTGSVTYSTTVSGQ